MPLTSRWWVVPSRNVTSAFPSLQLHLYYFDSASQKQFTNLYSTTRLLRFQQIHNLPHCWSSNNQFPTRSRLQSCTPINRYLNLTATSSQPQTCLKSGIALLESAARSEPAVARPQTKRRSSRVDLPSMPHKDLVRSSVLRRSSVAPIP